MPNRVTGNTVSRCLHSVEVGGALIDGADYRRHESQLMRLLKWLANLASCGKYMQHETSKIEDKEIAIHVGRFSLMKAVLNLNLDLNGNPKVGERDATSFSIDNKLFILKFEQNRWVVFPYLDPGNRVSLGELNMADVRKNLVNEFQKFNEFQKLALPPGTFNFWDIRLAGLTLNNEILKAIAQYGGDLTGTELSDDVDLSKLDFKNCFIDRSTALEFIRRGSDPADTFACYVKTQCRRTPDCFDFTGFDYTRINLEKALRHLVARKLKESYENGSIQLTELQKEQIKDSLALTEKLVLKLHALHRGNSARKPLGGGEVSIIRNRGEVIGYLGKFGKDGRSYVVPCKSPENEISAKLAPMGLDKMLTHVIPREVYQEGASHIGNKDSDTGQTKSIVVLKYRNERCPPMDPSLKKFVGRLPSLVVNFRLNFEEDIALNVGPDLSRLVRDKGYAFKLEHFLDLARDLAYMHFHGIVHRDIKPRNVGFLDGSMRLFDLDSMGRVGTFKQRFYTPQWCHQKFRPKKGEKSIDNNSKSERLNPYKKDQYAFFLVTIFCFTAEMPTVDAEYGMDEIMSFVQSLPCKSFLKEELVKFMEDPEANCLSKPLVAYLSPEVAIGEEMVPADRLERLRTTNLR